MDFLDSTPRLEVFRLAGVPIRIDVTFAFVPIFLLGILQQGPIEIAGPAFVAIIVGVFLSILFHELGHATVARAFAIPVGEILIGGFYGYARMMKAAGSTAAGVAILAAGPLANAVLFFVLWRLLGSPQIANSGRFGYIDPAGFLDERPWLLLAALTLARINLAMAIFNLLPAFPLDGGRIFRDLIATVSSRASAARIIAVFGVGVGLWGAIAGLRTDIVLMLIGAQIAIMNWAVLKDPTEGERY